jgi:hypothetical protein
LTAALRPNARIADIPAEKTREIVFTLPHLFRRFPANISALHRKMHSKTFANQEATLCNNSGF